MNYQAADQTEGAPPVVETAPTAKPEPEPEPVYTDGMIFCAISLI